MSETLEELIERCDKAEAWDLLMSSTSAQVATYVLALVDDNEPVALQVLKTASDLIKRKKV